MAAATLDQAWLDELSEWLRIPSVSADHSHHDDVVRAAEWLRDFIRAAGGECELIEGTSPRTLDEVGRAFNVTRERIRQIENNTLKKLETLPEAQSLYDCV